MFNSFSTITGTFRNSNTRSDGYAQFAQFALSFTIVSGYRNSILTEMIIASLNTVRETSISTILKKGMSMYAILNREKKGTYPS